MLSVATLLHIFFQPMTKTLNNIATIRNGHTFREKILDVADGGVHVLQIRDLRRQHTELNQTELQAESLPRIRWEENTKGSTKGLLSQDSVVLPARGEYYKASVFNGSAKVVASSQLLVLTLKDKNVLPAFLCWTLNQPTAQHYLQNESKGTNISLLSIHSLGLMPIHIPPLATQRKIIALQQLWEHEQQLTRQLLNNRETMLQGMFQQLMAGIGKKTPANGDTV